MKKEINILITLEKLKFLSVNAIYKAGQVLRGGKLVPYIYKDSTAKKFESIVDDQLRAIDFSEHLDWLRETKRFTVTQQYILKSGINRRDVGNLEKLVSDCCVRFIKNELKITHFDDSEFTDVHLYKSTIPGSQNEYLCIKIAPSSHNIRFDQIEKPEQILIHFRGNQDWETKDYKNAFKELSLKYQLCTTDKKIKDHNTDVIYINSEDPDFTEQIVDLMDFIYLHKDSGFVFVGIFGNNVRDELIEKIDNFGGSNIRALKIEDHKDITKLFINYGK